MEKTLKCISSKIGDFKPEIGIILGSGLGELADEYCDIAIPYGEIEGFISSTVKGHKGRLVFAEIFGKKVVMMQGRVHFYEGHTMQEITYPIKVMKKLGVQTVILTNAAGNATQAVPESVKAMKKLGVNTLILTNAAGGVNPDFKPADLMLITDHINNMGANPLVGKNDEEFGTRFPDMTEVYRHELINTAKTCGEELGIELREGVYLANSGPSYETPAEIRMYKLMGADAVGMSTIPEAIVGNYCGMKILGISCITNSASKTGGEKLSHDEVIEASNKAKNKFKKLVLKVVEKL